MKWFLSLIIMVLGITFFIVGLRQSDSPIIEPNENIVIAQEKGNNKNTTNFSIEPKNQLENKIDFTNSAAIDKLQERVSKKPFGIYITPQDSPVQPERFSGYHTGADFEVFAEELEANVEITAFCEGTLRLKRRASGYGGVTVQECLLENEAVTVVYGHLKISSITPEVGSNIKAGETIGILGEDKSTDTDGERKHLHLAVHKGKEINIAGYVQSASELNNWIDPMEYLAHKN